MLVTCFDLSPQFSIFLSVRTNPSELFNANPAHRTQQIAVGADVLDMEPVGYEGMDRATRYVSEHAMSQRIGDTMLIVSPLVYKPYS